MAPRVAPRPPESARPAPAGKDPLPRLIEGLKTAEYAKAAAALAQHGGAAVPALLTALERRDVEIRRQAVQVLQTILKRPVIFDPYAPEILRKQQLASLREQYERKAG